MLRHRSCTAGERRQRDSQFQLDRSRQRQQLHLPVLVVLRFERDRLADTRQQLQLERLLQFHHFHYLGVDPTGSGNLPNVSSLSGSTNYSWQIQASDTNGNSAQVQVSFETAATPLTLPASGALSSAVVGQSYSGAINASGGVGPNYTFSVNGSQVPTDGSQYAIADGIWVSNNSGNTLSIGGTPSAAQTVTLLNITVTDSGSNTAGPDTYTITVNAASPLSIQTATLPAPTRAGLQLLHTGLRRRAALYVTITSGSSSLTAVGLAFTGNPSNNQGSAEISGTPSAAGTRVSRFKSPIMWGIPPASRSASRLRIARTTASSQAITRC